MQKFFFEKFLFAYENRFAVEKNLKKFWAKFSKLLEKFFVSPSKKCQSYNIHIWELYDKHFFQKNENLSFLSPDCFIRNEFIPVFNHF